MIALVLLALAARADHRGWFVYPGHDRARYHERTCRVVQVRSGRLEVIDEDGSIEQVRLCGVDLTGASEPMRAAAMGHMEMVRGHEVRLQIPESDRPRDVAGSLLAYVVLCDGQVLNEQLLRLGLAQADRAVHHHHDAVYELLELEARRQKAGYWARSGRRGG